MKSVITEDNTKSINNIEYSPISVVIHTYNNEKIIRRCLDSVRNFDEIIICDMYSTDKTIEIAREYNCKIVYYENIGWADPARNYAIQQASNEWVLVVDSDEVISQNLVKYLYEFMLNSADYKAIRIPRLNYCWGEPLELLYPDSIIRFFKKDSIDWPPFVHATPQIDGKVYCVDPKRRDLAIIHYQDWTVSKIINSLNKYTDLEVEKLIESKRKRNIVIDIISSFFKIFEKFFIKKGYKNGLKGFIVCVLFYGLYKFCTICKYWEYMNGYISIKGKNIND